MPPGFVNIYVVNQKVQELTLFYIRNITVIVISEVTGRYIVLYVDIQISLFRSVSIVAGLKSAIGHI